MKATIGKLKLSEDKGNNYAKKPLATLYYNSIMELIGGKTLKFQRGV